MLGIPIGGIMAAGGIPAAGGRHAGGGGLNPTDGALMPGASDAAGAGPGRTCCIAGGEPPGLPANIES